MKTNFFQKIGECESNMQGEDAGIDADRIFLLVQDKILQSRKQRRKNIYLAVSALTCCAAVFAFVLLHISDTKMEIYENRDNVTQYHEAANDDQQKSAHIKVCVYESTQEGQFLTQNYVNEMKKKELKPDEKVVIGSYNPLDSSVPGYPVLISDERHSAKKRAALSLKVSAGSLIQWDRKTGEIIPLGKEYHFSQNANIYWSPLEDGKIVEKTIISAGVTDGLSQDDTINVTISKKNNVYIAERTRS